MIFDRVEYAKNYLGIDPNLDLALHDIAEKKFSKSIGDGIVICNESNPVTKTEGKFETHLVKADIHLLKSGEEKILISPVEDTKITETDAEKDYIGSVGEACSSVIMRPGFFLVVFPGEAHKVCQAVNEPMPIEKAVYKFSFEKTEEEK